MITGLTQFNETEADAAHFMRPVTSMNTRECGPTFSFGADVTRRPELFRWKLYTNRGYEIWVLSDTELTSGRSPDLNARIYPILVKVANPKLKWQPFAPTYGFARGVLPFLHQSAGTAWMVNTFVLDELMKRVDMEQSGRVYNTFPSSMSRSIQYLANNCLSVLNVTPDIMRAGILGFDSAVNKEMAAYWIDDMNAYIFDDLAEPGDTNPLELPDDFDNMIYAIGVDMHRPLYLRDLSMWLSPNLIIKHNQRLLKDRGVVYATGGPIAPWLKKDEQSGLPTYVVSNDNVILNSSFSNCAFPPMFINRLIGASITCTVPAFTYSYRDNIRSPYLLKSHSLIDNDVASIMNYYTEVCDSFIHSDAMIDVSNVAFIKMFDEYIIVRIESADCITYYCVDLYWGAVASHAMIQGDPTFIWGRR